MKFIVYLCLFAPIMEFFLSGFSFNRSPEISMLFCTGVIGAILYELNDKKDKKSGE